ncbi:asparagine synthase (glutamine-hydrolyzing) [Dyella sedimenti]|uniref:asparagine synthase (glutamine-hydrolyzing) n=1 Tax=Dyella sedimenti TaxID=2919947 RepID=UPI001FA9C916|nr:asparagine synthase (glutamine-hydrolyzing) [Dyella sedimenti]
MCGIAGFWDAGHRFGAGNGADVLRKMTRAISYRGPDDDGHFLEEATGVGLGHRRLAVVDLTPEGHQPMTSASGRYVMVFNGEVYNHNRLRPELSSAGFNFRGHSDTEVMLAAIEHWGLEGALMRFIGMFAFALWDRETRTLTLARDRLGVKPLYFGWIGSVFAFASELKALRAVPGFNDAVSREALALQLRHNYIPAPHSIYRSIRKLMPGSTLSLDVTVFRKAPDNAALDQYLKTYWCAREAAEKGARDRLNLGDGEVVAELDTVLRDAVGLRMEADVPLGAFLSGGIDSSLVVALMQAQASQPVKTFSIGFNEEAYDEARHAKAIATHLGTDHHELYVTANDALDVVSLLPTMFDEPFSDSSQIPTYLVSMMARRHVTVSLSGDGGDELFAGYTRYAQCESLWRSVAGIPSPARRGAAALLRETAGFWAGLMRIGAPLLPASRREKHHKDTVQRLATLLSMPSSDALYRRLVSHWERPADLVLGCGGEPPTALTDPQRFAALETRIERMMYTDMVSYLPDDVLVKVDRASMAVSLEAREPLLDHRLFEYSWRLPLSQKMRDGKGKWILRQVLYKYVPAALIERPKQGFGVPIGDWLRGPLRDWAEALLDEKKLREEGYLNPMPIRRMWSDHVSERVNEQYRLWDVLMFQAWNEARQD